MRHAIRRRLMRELRSPTLRFLRVNLGPTVRDFVLLRKLRSPLLNFFRAGLGPSILYFTIYIGLTRCVDITLFARMRVCYKVSEITAVVIAGTISLVLNFFLQKYWAFGDKRRHIPQQVCQFAGLKLGLFGLQTIFLYFLLHKGVFDFFLNILHWNPSLAVHDLLAHALIIPVLTGLSYVFTRKIFTQKSPAHTP